MSEDRYPHPPGGQPKIAIPLEWWKQARNEQLQLCRELETIADSLPANIDRQICLRAAKALGPLIKGVHHYEAEILFPALESDAQNVPDLLKTLRRLKLEHFEDECFAEEIAERLLLLGSGSGGINMEATGYMLRGFFEALRRHIAFEQDYFAALGVLNVRD